MGKGGRAVITKTEGDFFRTDSEEPHAIRRKAILEKHPEIQNLYGNEIRVVPFVLLIIASQLFLAYYSNFMSWPVFILVAWIYGGAASHSLSLMTHEVSHNLVFQSATLNEYFGILCNVGMGFPSSSMFKRYHMEHHQFQGHQDKDADIPTAWEGFIVGNSTIKKLIYLSLQMIAYGARPGFVRPKKLRMKEYINAAIVICTDVIIYKLCGITGLMYLLLSLTMGMGLHPVAGHFIAEHYVFNDGVETYSYYGSLNWICWNVGYHNEHHDFPRVPGWRLPQGRCPQTRFHLDDCNLNIIIP